MLFSWPEFRPFLSEGCLVDLLPPLLQGHFFFPLQNLVLTKLDTVCFKTKPFLLQCWVGFLFTQFCPRPSSICYAILIDAGWHGSSKIEHAWNGCVKYPTSCRISYCRVNMTCSWDSVIEQRTLCHSDIQSDLKVFSFITGLLWIVYFWHFVTFAQH